MNIQTFCMGTFQVNSYLAWCSASNEGIIIDPGEEPKQILEFIDGRGIRLKYIVLTHAHYDHVEGIKDILAKESVPLLAHPKAQDMLDILPKQAAMFNLVWDKPIPKVNKELYEGDIITFGSEKLKVLYTPGHSPCSVTLVGKDEAFTGDVIFFNTVGRTDFPDGSYEELMDSIHNRIFVLNPSLRLYSGHGPVTTIERERQENPFI